MTDGTVVIFLIVFSTILILWVLELKWCKEKLEGKVRALEFERATAFESSYAFVGEGWAKRAERAGLSSLQLAEFMQNFIERVEHDRKNNS